MHDTPSAPLSVPGVLAVAVTIDKKAKENKMGFGPKPYLYAVLLCVSVGLLWPSLWAVAQFRGTAEEHAQRGAVLLSQGHWEGAMQELRAALRLDPDHVGAQANLGMALYFTGNMQAAISAFQATLQIDPQRVDAAHGLGLALYEEGDLDGAVAAFRTASRLNPTAYYNLGNALERRGDHAEALEAYRSYLAAVPQSPETLALQAAVNRGTRPTPAAGTAQEHFQRGERLLEEKDAARAVTAFLAALRLKPSSVEACNGLGQAFRLKGDLDEAIAGYQMALRLDPKFGAAHRNLGQAFEEKGEFALAARAYDRYLLLVPGAEDAAEVRDKIARLRRGAS